MQWCQRLISPSRQCRRGRRRHVPRPPDRIPLALIRTKWVLCLLLVLVPPFVLDEEDLSEGLCGLDFVPEGYLSLRVTVSKLSLSEPHIILYCTQINSPCFDWTMPGDTDPAREPLLGSSSGQVTYTAPIGSEGNKTDHRQPAKIVHFFADDPEDPRNWPRWKKWLMIGPILLIDLSVSWGASGFSPASSKFAHEFGLPAGLGTLGLSSYVLGLAFGPMTLAPLSEVSPSNP